jgi:hypothetical protein
MKESLVNHVFGDNSLPRIEAKPLEMSRHLKDLKERHPDLTYEQLAERIGRSVEWVKSMLSLNTLCDEAKTLIDNGMIPLTSGYILARYPHDKQIEILPDAKTLGLLKFAEKYS